MKKLNDNLSEIFDVEPIETTQSLPVVTQTTEIVVGDEVETDAALARKNIKSLLDKGSNAIDNLLLVAQESEHPRAYEVAGQLMKNAGEIADKILLVHKILKDVEEDKPKGPTTVNNALFVGSTADLAKFLKQQSENENV